MNVRLPNVISSTTVAAQPQLALDASQIEAFRKVVIVSELLRGDRDRAAWRLMLPGGVSPIAFGLITILQSQVRPQLKWAETETERCCSRKDLGDGSALKEAKITDGQFGSHHGVTSRRGREMLAGEKPRCRLIHRDGGVAQFLDKLRFRQAAHGNGSADGRIIWVHHAFIGVLMPITLFGIAVTLNRRQASSEV